MQEDAALAAQLASQEQQHRAIKDRSIQDTVMTFHQLFRAFLDNLERQCRHVRNYAPKGFYDTVPDDVIKQIYALEKLSGEVMAQLDSLEMICDAASEAMLNQVQLYIELYTTVLRARSNAVAANVDNSSTPPKPKNMKVREMFTRTAAGWPKIEELKSAYGFLVSLLTSIPAEMRRRAPLRSAAQIGASVAKCVACGGEATARGNRTGLPYCGHECRQSYCADGPV